MFDSFDKVEKILKIIDNDWYLDKGEIVWFKLVKFADMFGIIDSFEIIGSSLILNKRPLMKT